MQARDLRKDSVSMFTGEKKDASSRFPDVTRRSVLGGIAGSGLMAALSLRMGAGNSSAATESSTPIARSQSMTVWRPDPTFYPSARSAMTAPPEEFAYVVRVNPNGDER